MEQIPLYHATSQYFYDGILRSGFNSIDIVNESKAKDLLGDAVNYVKSEDPKNAIWQKNHLSLSQFLEQSVTGGGFNFRHGKTYWSGSKQTANRYLKNVYGSEFISSTAELVNSLPVKNELYKKYLEFSEMINDPRMKGKVLIKLTKYDEQWFRTERGENASTKFEEMEEFADNEDLLQLFNFEMISIVAINECKYELPLSV